MISKPRGVSERLRFEPLVPEHVEAMQDALMDPAVYLFMGVLPKTADDLRKRFERMVCGPGTGRTNERWWNICVFPRNGPVGMGMLEASFVEDRVEIAYYFGHVYWGLGYAFEAVTWLHERLASDGTASTFWATTLPVNERSQRLLKRLGYELIPGEFPELLSYDPGDLVFRKGAESAFSKPR